MDEATIAQTILSLAILAIFLGFLIWGIKSGQFHNIEEPKYHMLEDKNKRKTDNPTPEEGKEKKV